VYGELEELMVWEEIGKRIKSLRDERNMTQEQFGALIGKSAQYISRIEKGQKASVELIVAICKETGITMDYLVLGIENPTADMAVLDGFSPEQIEISLDIIKKVTELIRTPNGNNLLIKELMRRQSIAAEGL
jgi:transcriptional regulator with XRE-family HTH domain